MEGRSRKSSALACFFLCSLAALASCEGDDTFLDVDKEISANSEFAGSLDLDLGVTGQGLILTEPINDGDTQRTIVITNPEGGRITGTFSADSAMMTVGEGSGMSVATTNPADSAPEDFTVTVEEAMVFQEQFPLLGEYIPLSGSFTVTGGGESVAVTFLDSPSARTVGLSLNGTPEVIRDLFDFEDTIGLSVPAWEEKASLSFNILYLLVQQAFFVYDTSSLIEAYKGDLSSSGGLTFVCESISTQGTANPASPDATSLLSWIDTNGNGNVDSGDGFDWLMFSCWQNQARRELNDLLDGTVNLAGYIMEKTQSGNEVQVSRFGFDPGREDVPGVRYADFGFINIREESVGYYLSNPNSAFTMNGGLDITFSRTDAAGSEIR